MKLLPIALASLACLSAVSGDRSVSASGAEAEFPEAQRKRDAGYAYVRPSRYSAFDPGERAHTTRIVVARGPGAEASRPFARYGPPRQQSGGFRQGSVRPQQNLHILIEDASSGVQKQRAPSPAREYEFAEASPIAGQNDLPFASKSANYLPPSNQKLPGPTRSPYGFANDHQLSSRLEHHQSPARQITITDAAAFLAENSRAISQLYETPAADIDYHPSSSKNRENTNNFNEMIANFRPIDNLPSYASGFVDRDALGSIKSLEKDRLIKQLQRELVDVRGKNLDLNSRSPQNSHNNGNLGSPMTTSGYTYGLPATLSTVPTPTSTLVTAPTNQSPQTSASHPTSPTGISLPQPANSVQFPQFAAGFVPSLVPNYLTGFPVAPIGGVLASASTNLDNSHAPTHFGIPIPTVPTSVQKPGAPTISQNPQNPINSVPGQSLSPIPTNPIQQFPLLPAVTPIHQLVNPAATNLIGHPTYGVQSTDQLHVNKPIKAVYPVYYYHNLYQLQKPGLATLPWNYAPSYSQQIRPEQAWK